MGFSDIAGARLVLLAGKLDADFAQLLFSVGSEAITRGFSPGIAHFPGDGETVDELICATDIKMYAEKNARYAVKKRRRYTDRSLPETVA